MPKTKQKAEYSNVKIPTTVIYGIQKLIDFESDIFRYRSPADFVIETVRLRLEEYEKKIKDHRDKL